MLSWSNSSIWEMFIFYKYKYFSSFEIALAIPASNEWKIVWNNSAGQGLRSKLYNEAG